MAKAHLLTAVLLLSCARLCAAKEEKPSGPAAAERANAIAFKFYGEEARKPGNVFFSPYSVYSAFAMTYEGARGATAEEIASVFSFPKKTRDLKSGLAALRKDMAAALKGAEFEQANSLWAQKGYKFKDAYLKTLRADYSAEALTADFKTRAEEARKGINAWTEARTKGRIRGLFPEGALNSLTRLVLVNAVYFKGRWEQQFDKRLTAEADFTMSGGQKTKASLMTTPKELEAQYWEDEGLQALRLPYRGGLAMLVLLPREGRQLSSLEKGFGPERLAAVRRELGTQRVKVFLPRFKFDSGFRLNSALSELGMPTAFTEKADFSGMDGTRKLFIQNAFHKAFVEVTEEGTEAAAATGVAMGTKSLMLDFPVFRADRPFLFLIEEPASGLILFMGRVEDPNRQ